MHTYLSIEKNSWMLLLQSRQMQRATWKHIKTLRDVFSLFLFQNVTPYRTLKLQYLFLYKSQSVNFFIKINTGYWSTTTHSYLIFLYLWLILSFVGMGHKYIKSYYRTRPSVFKLVQLLSTENVKELCNLGKFLINAYKLRENLNSV